MKKLLVGVTGSIATYKALEIVRNAINLGWEVQVVMTKDAMEFIQPLSFQVLSKNKVAHDLFNQEKMGQIDHIALAQSADVFLVAPASAHTLAKLAIGLADDLLTTIALATKAPLVLAPAMNNLMWEHPTVALHLKNLQARGATIIDPEEGYLACETIGKGRLAAIDKILQSTESALIKVNKPLNGIKILVTAGATIQPIDPFRFLSNPSSGKMGLAIAKICKDWGAEVTILAGRISVPVPTGFQIDYAETTSAMAEKFFQACPNQDVIFQVAAISDYKTTYRTSKIKDAELKIEFKKDQDLLATYGKQKKAHQVLVGFAAEVEDVLRYAQKKLLAKNCDLIVANAIDNPSYGFQSDFNQIKLVLPNEVIDLPPAHKDELAKKIVELAFSLYQAKQISA